jgi:plasmid stabilization system protein ParE
MNTRLSPAALDDLEDIMQDLSTRSASAASGFRDRLRDMRHCSVNIQTADGKPIRITYAM